MARASKITVDVTTNLFSLCEVRCDNYSCVYKEDRDPPYIDEGLKNCSLKHIKIGVDGKCENYRTSSMLV